MCSAKRQQRCRQFKCSVFGDSSSLAVYPFPSSVQRHGGTLFSQSFQELMHNLSDSPLIQLSYRHSVVWHERHSVEFSSMPRPELWEDFAAEASTSAADLLMFVRPVASASELCVKKAPQPSACPDSQCLSFSGQNPSNSIAGRVGDCCDEEDDHASEMHAKRVLESPDMHIDAEYLDMHGLHVQYYGLVSQSGGQEQSDGCYLIKTVRQLESTGCHCMHYSLMRVCQGVSLQRQALEYWL